jgi:hypothetical protein
MNTHGNLSEQQHIVKTRKRNISDSRENEWNEKHKA